MSKKSEKEPILYDPKVKVPPNGTYIKLYYKGCYPCLAYVVHNNELILKSVPKKQRYKYIGIVNAEGIFQFKDDKTVTKFTVQLNHPTIGQKHLKWYLVGQSKKAKI